MPHLLIEALKARNFAPGTIADLQRRLNEVGADDIEMQGYAYGKFVVEQSIGDPPVQKLFDDVAQVKFIDAYMRGVQTQVQQREEAGQIQELRFRAAQSGVVYEKWAEQFAAKQEAAAVERRAEAARGKIAFEPEAVEGDGAKVGDVTQPPPAAKPKTLGKVPGKASAPAKKK